MGYRTCRTFLLHLKFAAFAVSLLLVLPIIALGQNKIVTPKTSSYFQYQTQNAYKGIKFGSVYSDIKDRLLLTNPYDNSCKIENPSYLNFNYIQFASGQAYFTPKSGKFYQIVIYTRETDYLTCLNKYKQVVRDFKTLFGTNDAEYIESVEDAKVNGQPQSRNISWYGEIKVYVSIQSGFSKTYQVEVTILNEPLNSIANDERSQMNSSAVIPKI